MRMKKEGARVKDGSRIYDPTPYIRDNHGGNLFGTELLVSL